MCVLNDRWIKDNAWMFDPYDEKMVNPSSIDLRWSGRVRRMNLNLSNRTREVWNKQDLPDLFLPYTSHEILYIHPGEFVLVDTLETIQMPIDVCGLLMLKSSSGRFGLEHHHAGFFDPGFGLGNPSTGTLELTNTSAWVIAIRKGQPIVQMVFMRMENPPEADYRTTGKYNGQVTPQEAKL